MLTIVKNFRFLDPMGAMCRWKDTHGIGGRLYTHHRSVQRARGNARGAVRDSRVAHGGQAGAHVLLTEVGVKALTQAEGTPHPHVAHLLGTGRSAEDAAEARARGRGCRHGDDGAVGRHCRRRRHGEFVKYTGFFYIVLHDHTTRRSITLYSPHRSRRRFREK